MPHVRAGEIELYYETHGDTAAPPVVMIMGLGAQMVMWPEALWEPLVAKGLQVTRFDNRDVGLSQKMEAHATPVPWRNGLRWLARQPVEHSYSLDDMAQDAIHLIEALHGRPVHLVGASMGGMIAQLVAARRPDVLSSLTLVMSSPGGRRLPGPHPRVSSRLLLRPGSRDEDTIVNFTKGTLRRIGSPPEYMPDDILEAMARRNFRRAYYPPGYKRQLAASLAAPPRHEVCRTIRTPTLVVHGQRDPLIPLAHGRALRDLIPNARLAEIAEMGHDLPPALCGVLADLMADHFDAV